MSKFRELSNPICHRQNHIVWAPKYRFRMLEGAVRDAVRTGVKAICGFVGCEVVEMNVQRDHVRLVVMIRPKVEVSELLGRINYPAASSGVLRAKTENPFRGKPRGIQP